MSTNDSDLRAVVDARVLVVEDEKIIARDIEQTLRGLGYDVVGSADTGEEAVRRALSDAPDLVLMDVRLRGEMDGIHAAELIHQTRDVPIVFLTAFADEATLRRARRVAPYGYVLKPFEDRDLHVAVMMALCKHRAFVELDQRVRERTEELLRTEVRFRQMASIAELGVFALRTQELQPVLDRAVTLVTETLGTELVEVLERLAGGGGVTLRAGLGWRAGLVGHATFGTEASSEAGFTLVTDAPVIVDDLRTETRFGAPPLLADQGAVSGVSVPIWSPTQPEAYGVLAAHAKTQRTFASHEVAFLQAVANLVGTTVARVRADEHRLSAERSAESERARAEHALDAVRLRDEFLSIASHELKTPLTALQLQLESLTTRLDSLDASTASKLERATRSTDRLAALVEVLLDVSKLSTGPVELHLEELVLQDVAQSTVDRVAEAALHAGCALELVDESDGPLRGWWDRLRLEQMLLNLVGNGLKYATGSPIRVVLRRVGADAELTVEDEGPGISTEHAERIFDRFERAASVRNYGGLGLGLYVTRQLAEAHGGTIQVQSAPGQGAAFTIRLPLAPANDRRAPKEALQ